MKNNNLLSLLIIAALVAGVYFIVQTIQKSAQAATAPFQQVNQANQSLQTQVSNLLHPTPTIIPDPVTYINEVRALARLETIQYSIEKVITGETGGGTFKALFGDKMLFVAHGTVIVRGSVPSEEQRRRATDALIGAHSLEIAIRPVAPVDSDDGRGRSPDAIERLLPLAAR